MYLSQENIEPASDNIVDESTGELKIPASIEEVKSALAEQVFFRTLLYGFITNIVTKFIWRKR